MASLAMAGELHALFVDEHVDVLQVPRLAKCVGMDGLPPLVVGLLVAMSAVLGGGEALGVRNWPLDEVALEGRNGVSFPKA